MFFNSQESKGKLIRGHKALESMISQSLQLAFHWRTSAADH